VRNRKRTWIRSWILKRAVLGFAVAALVVPAAAQARIDEGMNGQPNSSAEVSKSGDFIPGVTDFPSYANQSVKTGDEELLEKNRGVSSTVATPQLVSSPGFDWGDAGIGAGIALGLVLLGGAAFGAARRLGKPQTT
jgi:hypothetical protein